MTDVKLSEQTGIRLTDAWLRSIGGEWRQVEWDTDSTRFKHGKRVMDVWVGERTLEVRVIGARVGLEARMGPIVTQEDFLVACEVLGWELPNA